MDDWGNEFQRLEAGAFSPHYIAALLNEWGIRVRGPWHWRLETIEDAIGRFVGADALAAARSAETVAQEVDEEMAENEIAAAPAAAGAATEDMDD